MLILLPPSEGKTPAGTGNPVDLDELSLPSLNPTRERLLKALVRLSGGQPARARRVLGVTERQVEEIERNRLLLQAPAAPASQVYSGVVYDTLGYAQLPAAARRRLDRWVLVASALWGAVRLNDSIPAYRLSSGVTLPRIGPVVTAWRKPLSVVMPEVAGAGVVFDLRSGSYASMWAPHGESALVARVVQRLDDGSLRVVSHHNKATKGRLVRDLSRQTSTPSSVDELLELLSALNYETVEKPTKPGHPRHVDIIVAEI